MHWSLFHHREDSLSLITSFSQSNLSPSVHLICLLHLALLWAGRTFKLSQSGVASCFGCCVTLLVFALPSAIPLFLKPGQGHCQAYRGALSSWAAVTAGHREPESRSHAAVTALPCSTPFSLCLLWTSSCLLRDSITVQPPFTLLQNVFSSRAIAAAGMLFPSEV